MLVLILVAVEASSGMNEYGTNAIIPGRLRHNNRVGECNFGSTTGLCTIDRGIRLGLLESRRKGSVADWGRISKMIYRFRYVQNMQVATRPGRSEVLEVARELATFWTRLQCPGRWPMKMQ
jgi:hypothetical protein